MATDINKDNSFWIRFRSSIILMIITVASIVIGGYVLWGVLLAVSLIGLMELYRAMGINKKPIAYAGYLAAVIWFVFLLDDYIGGCFIGTFFSKMFGDADGLNTRLILLTFVFLTVVLAIYVLSFPKYNSEQTTMVFFGLFYVAVTLSFIFRVRCAPSGSYTVWLIFVGSWGADTMAYVVGRKIGRHKIVPVLSPKKSLEGFIGGIIGASLIGIIYSAVFKQQLLGTFGRPILSFAVISAVCAVISMIGDLAASAIKRDKQIKDYGRLIPGHGGILDRFDSVIFIAPIVYFLVNYLKF